MTVNCLDPHDRNRGLDLLVAHQLATVGLEGVVIVGQAAKTVDF